MKWKKWLRRFFHFSFLFRTFAHNYGINLIIEKRMKRKLLLLAFCGFMITAMADWTYGTASFKGSQPSSSMSVGGVMIWYNGSLSQTGNEGGVQIWEGTSDICVVFPKNYNGPKMRFLSKGGTVQIQTLR